MSIDDIVARIKDDAISAAESFNVDEQGRDYKVGYTHGVRMMAKMIELSRMVAVDLAEENKFDPLVYKTFMGYANSLMKLIEASDDLIPPEFETGAV